MRKKPASQSGLFNPRVLCAFALCSVGALLAMLSLAATTLSELESSPSRKPVEAPRANTSVPPDPANFLSTFGSNANRLPPGVPLPPSGLDAPPGRKPGTQFSVNEQGAPLSSSPTAGFPPPGRKPSGLDAGFAWRPLRPGKASVANSLGDPVLANQQPAPLSMQQPAASESMPLTSGAAGDWSIVPSPNTSSTQYNVLQAVTCTSASDCWAVGFYTGSTLIERWNGTLWAIVTSPNVILGNSFLYGVTCTSASDCWAVGYSDTGIAKQTLIERWNGTSWATVTSPNIGVQENFLFGVTCASTSDCWAVGYYNDTASSGSVDQTLIERWDGTAWAIVVSLPTNASQHNFLHGVTCTSASDCWAVGYSAGNGTQTLIERWDGTLWAIVTSPNTSPTRPNVLTGVTCVSASNCWAVGYYGSSIAYQTLIEQWDGASWAIVTSPNTSPTQNDVLLGVTCVSASECWAVGYYFANGSAYQTLIEEFTIPVQLVSVVSRKVHGSAGTFDIDLPLTGTRGIECRSGGASGNYTMVFTFLNPVTNCGAASTGSLSSGPDPKQCTVNLTGVPNAQYITVTLTGAADSTGATGNVSATMGVLIGDVNATGLVDGNDVSAVQGQARQTANSTNFRLDVNTTGLIDGNDVSLVQSKTRTSLPTPP